MKGTQMKNYRALLTMFPIILLTACKVFAQDAGEFVVAPVPQVTLGGTCISLMFTTGLLGFLIWAAILFWAILLIPLGVRSLIASATLKSKQWPLSTKLLLFGPVFLLLLGFLGVAHFLIHMCASFTGGTPDIGMFWANAYKSLYSVAGSLFLIQFYLMFFMISFVIIHFKCRRMDGDS
jgi:hypothetical protein